MQLLSKTAYSFVYMVALISSFLLTSCTSKKKLVYFNSQEAIKNSETNKNYTPVFRADDLLSITVSAIDQDAVKPFNLVVTQGAGGNLAGYTTGLPSVSGYLIDSEGNIDFPVIGKIKLQGLNRMEASELIRNKLKDYINTPIVNIRILNYKITVLGDVKNPGTINIPNERVTLLEALGIAGDLNITGKRKNVLVIRDVDGKKTETRIDLTSKELFSSPVFYLSQNDIVYVEPNRAKINSSVVNASNVGIVISIVSLLTTIAVLLSR
jgi:polysaccharide export outer membrane protein